MSSNKLKQIFEKHSSSFDEKSGGIIEETVDLMTIDQFEKALSELGFWMSDEDIEKAAFELYPANYPDILTITNNRIAAVVGMKHYRDNASPVRFVTNQQIEDFIKSQSTTADENLEAPYWLNCRVSMRKIATWMRDLIFKR